MTHIACLCANVVELTLFCSDRLQHSFTIVEGWTWKDILTQLKHNTRIEHSSESEITDFFSKHPFMIRGTLAHLEGVFLPDTYHFSSGDLGPALPAFTA